MLTLIEFLIDSIFYGFGATTLTLYILCNRGGRLKFDLDTVIESNNLLVLGRTFLFLLLISITIFSAWYSSTEHEQFAFINRWTGPFAIFAWVSFLLNYLLPLLMINQQNRRSILKSVLVLALWVINYLLHLSLVKLPINSSHWSLLIKPDYYHIAKCLLAYFTLLGLTYILKKRTS